MWLYTVTFLQKTLHKFVEDFKEKICIWQALRTSILHNMTSENHIWKGKKLKTIKQQKEYGSMCSTWGLPLMLMDWFDDWLEIFVSKIKKKNEI